jgi:RES domain-containing protein
MANNPARRPIRLPTAYLSAQPLPRTRQIARAWYRVHQTIHDAIYFSLIPTHRFSHPKCSSKFLYVAIDPGTCIWERFGDQIFDNDHALPKTHWDDASISAITVPPLHVCDLSRTSTRGALAVDLAALMNDDLSVPQQWGLAIQRHPAQVPAIKFKSRFTGLSCLAIFERGSVPAQLKEKCLGPINQYAPALDWLSRNRVSLV